MRPVIVAAALFAAACSRSSGAPDAGGATAPGDPSAKFAHPCSLLQRADAEGILGTSDLHQEEQGGPPGDARCAWSVKGARGMVELRVNFPTRKDGFDQGSPDRTLVPGIGDRAYVQRRLSWGHVDVLKGDQTFFVQIEQGSVAGGHPSDPDQLRTQAVILARTVASRM